MHTVGHLPQNTCLLISSLHLTKISLLLPTSTPHTHTLPTMAAIFLLSYLILRLFVFQSHPFSVSLGQVTPPPLSLSISSLFITPHSPPSLPPSLLSC